MRGIKKSMERSELGWDFSGDFLAVFWKPRFCDYLYAEMNTGPCNCGCLKKFFVNFHQGGEGRLPRGWES